METGTSRFPSSFDGTHLDKKQRTETRRQHDDQPLFFSLLFPQTVSDITSLTSQSSPNPPRSFSSRCQGDFFLSFRSHVASPPLLSLPTFPPSSHHPPASLLFLSLPLLASPPFCPSRTVKHSQRQALSYSIQAKDQTSKRNANEQRFTHDLREISTTRAECLDPIQREREYG